MVQSGVGSGERVPAESFDDFMRRDLILSKPNPNVREQLAGIKGLVTVGPVAAGKDFVQRLIRAEYPGRYEKCITATTREPRTEGGREEQHGIDYYFYDSPYMLGAFGVGSLIECKANGSRFDGLPIDSVLHVAKEGRVPLFDIDVKGARDVLDVWDELDAVFVLPPSTDIWLKRLQKRNPAAGADLTIERLLMARYEFQVLFEDERFYPIISNYPRQIILDLQEYLHGGHASSSAARDVRIRAGYMARELDYLLQGLPDPVAGSQAVGFMCKWFGCSAEQWRGKVRAVREELAA